MSDFSDSCKMGSGVDHCELDLSIELIKLNNICYVIFSEHFYHVHDSCDKTRVPFN